MESLEGCQAMLPPEHQQEVRDFSLFLREKGQAEEKEA